MNRIRSGLAMVAVASCVAAWAEVTPHPLISNGMVLQRDAAAPVWGWATMGETVTVEFAGAKKTATADVDGKWMVKLDPLPTSTEPRVMSIVGSSDSKKIDIANVLVGEVWICSGQSNMEWSVKNSLNADEEAQAANFTQVRMFKVQKGFAKEPLDKTVGDWQEALPENVPGFSAVGYFFGRELHRSLGIPVGLIHTSWGGTPAEAWTSRATLESDPDLKPIVERFDKATDPEAIAKAKAAMAENLKIWEEARKNPNQTERQVDPGDAGFGQGWASLDFAATDWQDIKIPCQYDSALDGAFWFRKEIDIPAAWAGQELDLQLGAIDDFDTTWFNNVKVGTTGKDTKDWWMVPRAYRVPGELVKAGKAVIAVRVFDDFMTGGMVGPELSIGPVGQVDGRVSLAGTWKTKVEVGFNPLTLKNALRPGEPGINQNSPAALYNAMIMSIVPYAVQGAIWYQGESNAGRAFQYRKLLPAMIADWRKLWNENDFHFGIVSLANFTAAVPEPAESTWAELREAQTLTARMPLNGQAMAIDIGDALDIHPKNKQDVGKRLALWALACVYGQQVEYAGPVYRSMKVEGGKIRLSFDHLGGGLVAKDGPLKTFAVAGADKKFHWADDVVIDGDTVVVSAKAVPAPVAVRYAWANNPEGCNLYNQAGLPAEPFRTDAWPASTDTAR
jgi:sialate O-acetylesterase